jgi:hypothetical protein
METFFDNITQGNIYYVKPYSGSDGMDGLSPQNAFKTLKQAKASATANHNDVVYFFNEGNTSGLTTDYQSTALNWDKDGVHLIGVGACPMIGQRSRIAQLATVKNIEDLFTVSANNCYIANIEVYHGVTSSTATAPRAAVVTGMRNKIENCSFAGNGDSALSMDVAGARSLAASGQENLFINCYIGLDTCLRVTALAEVSVDGTRNIFENCHFETWTSLSTFKMVNVATTVDRFVKFKNCEFYAAQNITSAVAPTGAFGVTTLNGLVLLVNPYLTGFANYTTADNTYVKVLAHDGTATGHLIGVAQSVDVA